MSRSTRRPPRCASSWAPRACLSTEFHATAELRFARRVLDAGGDLEQQLVAISRGREVANVYAVASTELVDPDLGPTRRELSDDLHDIRGAIEREGNEWTAAEVALRRRIELLEPAELAARRAELAEAGRAADPALARREQLDREIEDATERVDSIEAMSEPPADELARVTTGEAKQADRLQRCLAERGALPASTATAEPTPPDPNRRLEAVLVNQRIDRLARSDVQAGRIELTHPIYNTRLGCTRTTRPTRHSRGGEVPMR